MELRCPTGKVLHGVVSDNAKGYLDVSCRGKWCGKKPGVVVIHRFDLATGKVVETKKFQEPTMSKRRVTRRTA